MQCKWWAYKWSTGPRIKKNMYRCIKDKHYTCHRVWIGLCFIRNHCKNTSLGPLLLLDSLSPKTTAFHWFWWLWRSHSWFIETLNWSPRLLVRLPHWTSTTKHWTILLRCLVCPKWKHTPCSVHKSLSELMTVETLFKHHSKSEGRTRWWQA